MWLPLARAKSRGTAPRKALHDLQHCAILQSSLRGERIQSMGEIVNQAQLLGLLLAQGDVDKQECVKLSATKFIAAAHWRGLKRYEQEFLRCYAMAAAAHRAILVGRSAARLHGIWVIPSRRETVELAQRSGNPPSKSQWPDGITYHRMSIPDSDISQWRASDPAGAPGTLRVTNEERTVVDIARLHGVRDGVVAMDSLFLGQPPINRIETRKRLISVLKRLTGKRGIGDARLAFELSSEHSESAYETLFRVILQSNGIDVQEQMWIGKFRVDLLWGQLIIEIDGAAKYEDLPHDKVIKQLARENWLREQGYEVIRLFPAEILRDEEKCLRRVIEAKQRADARGPVLTRPSQYRA